MDFAEDWPLREKFLEQLETSDKWKKAGLTAVKHQGITPGVTNVLAKYAADQLDKAKFEKMKDEYYKLRGWDIDTGNPTRENFVKLGLKDVADSLDKLGRLPKKKET
jgi:aldehyde:ferredoxin oxidoreductase